MRLHEHFEWDADKARKNLRKHRVSFDDAALVLADEDGRAATLDLRVDYLRPATPGRRIVGRGECYGLTKSIAFVRGTAHDGDADDLVAHVTGTFISTE